MPTYAEVLKSAMDRVQADGGPAAFRVGATPDPAVDGDPPPVVEIDVDAMWASVQRAAFEAVEKLNIAARIANAPRRDRGPTPATDDATATDDKMKEPKEP